MHVLSSQAFCEHRRGSEIVAVARDEAQGAAFWQAGLPIALYPFRDALDFVVEHLAKTMRSERRARTDV